MSMFDSMTDADMMQAFMEFVASRNAGKPQATFRDLWAKYAAYGVSATDGGRTRIRSWAKNQGSHDKRLLHFFGDLPWSKCDLAKVEEYRQWRQTMPSETGNGTKSVKAATRNRELRSAQACLSYARRQNLIPRNPMAGMRDEEEIHDRAFTLEPQQFISLVRHSRPMLRYFLMLSNMLGMRRGELLNTEWIEVDLDAGFILIPKHKTKAGKERDVPLPTNAMLILEMMPADGVNPFVFAHDKRPDGHLPEETLYDWFVEARERAQVKGPKGQEVWLHTLRHTAATDLVVAGMDVETVMSIFGWTSQRQMGKYVNIARRQKNVAKGVMDRRNAQMDEAMKLAVGSGAARPKRAPVADEPEAVTEALALEALP